MDNAVQIIFSVATIIFAAFGVVLQNDSFDYAARGEVPDTGGSAALGGLPGGSYEAAKAFYVDLRKHYRTAASVLSKVANLILLISVISGVLAGFTEKAIVARVLIAAWFVMYVWVALVIQRLRKPILKASRT